MLVMISPPWTSALDKMVPTGGSKPEDTWEPSHVWLYRLKPALELKPIQSQCSTCSNLNNLQETYRHGEGGTYHGDPQQLWHVCVPIWGSFQLHLQQVRTHCLLEGKVEGLEASLATHRDLSGKRSSFWARQKDFQSNNNNSGRKTTEKTRTFGEDTWWPVTQRTRWSKKCSLSVTKQNQF